MTLPFWFEATVMALNAGFGAAIARSRKAPVLGTLFAGLVVGLGGGMVRDVLLGQEPVAISSPVLIPVCLATGLAGALAFHRIVAMPRPLILVQGIVLGTLVTIGAQKALDFTSPIVSAMLLGVVTASCGGLIADIIAGRRSTVAGEAQWILPALTLGSVVFVLVSLWLGFWPAVVAGVAVTAAFRYVGQVRDWPSPRWPGRSRSTA